MRRSLPVALTGLAIILGSACGSVTQAPDGSGQAGSSAGTSGQAGSGQGGGAAGTTGQAGSSAGTTGQAGSSAGTTGQAGSGQGGGAAGTTGQAGSGSGGGAAGRGGQGGGTAGTTGVGGRGGTTGAAGNGGRGGQAGGTAGAGGRGGASGTTGRGGQGGGVSCGELEAEYSKAVIEARECTPGVANQCQQTVNGGLSCPGCTVVVNDATAPNAIRAQWNRQGCTPGIICPAIICVLPGPGVCTRTDGSSGGLCTSSPITPI